MPWTWQLIYQFLQRRVNDHPPFSDRTEQASYRGAAGVKMQITRTGPRVFLRHGNEECHDAREDRFVIGRCIGDDVPCEHR